MTIISHGDLLGWRLPSKPVNDDERQTKFQNGLQQELKKVSVIVIPVPGPSNGLSNLSRCFDVDKKGPNSSSDLTLFPFTDNDNQNSPVLIINIIQKHMLHIWPT